MLRLDAGVFRRELPLDAHSPQVGSRNQAEEFRNMRARRASLAD
jgi:hypothetical protein